MGYLALLLYVSVFFLKTKLYSSLCPYARIISRKSVITLSAACDINFKDRSSFGFTKLCFSENLNSK